jgi:hypothetical protein
MNHLLPSIIRWLQLTRMIAEWPTHDRTRALTDGSSREIRAASASKSRHRLFGVSIGTKGRARRLAGRKVWRRAPDGRVCIDLQGFEQWVEGR